MKIAEKNVKCGEIMIFNHTFYVKKCVVSFKPFVPTVGMLSTNFMLLVGFLDINLMVQGSA